MNRFNPKNKLRFKVKAGCHPLKRTYMKRTSNPYDIFSETTLGTQTRHEVPRFWRACGFVGLEEEEFKKRTIVVLLLISSAVGGIFYSAVYCIKGYPQMMWGTYLFLVTAALNMVWLSVTKNFRVFRLVTLSCYLVFPTINHFLIGGYVDSSAVVLSIWQAPLCAMVFASKRTARFFYWGFVLVMAASLFFEWYFQLPELHLSRGFRVSMFIFIIAVTSFQAFFLMESFLIKKDAMQEALFNEKQRTETLLLNILPEETAAELKQTGAAKARNFPSTTVMFTDFVGFSKIAAALSPEKLVEELDYYFQAFDEITDRHRLEKIKTIGDSYMCAGGVPVANETHASDAVRAGLEICAFVKNSEAKSLARCGFAFAVRVGIHSGPVVAGVVGAKKFAFDIWGDSVNLAARMEQASEPNQVNISQNTFDLVGKQFACEHRGKISAKNRGEVDMYFVGPVLAG